ncbi:MAG TPA: hypothetical protein VGK04_03495 [Thermoanaerobaculia bacterium]|jgi:hypothetical protein
MSESTNRLMQKLGGFSNLPFLFFLKMWDESLQLTDQQQPILEGYR